MIRSVLRRHERNRGRNMVKAQATAGERRATKSASPEDRERAVFVMELVALATGVSAAQSACETRNYARAARARQIAMYLTYIAWQWPLARVGRAFGRDRTTAGYACRLIEDLRDNEAFDAKLERLEACLHSAPPPKAVKLLYTNLLEMAS